MARHFRGHQPPPPSNLLRETLDENLVLSVSIGTEKARSELVIAPILLDVRRQAGRRISFFSGRKFDIDPARSLTGTCDFLISRSPNQRLVEAPVIAITEAKRNETLEDGIGQCAAEMFAAKIFNEKRGIRCPRFSAG